MTRMFSGKPFARAEAWIKGHVSAGSYVRDGLVAMWDGIENAGWGEHNPNATSWKDLVSGQSSDMFQSTEEVSDDAVFTTTRELRLMDDVEAIANGIDVLTVQRVAQEMTKSVSSNAACGVAFCQKRFGYLMYFRHNTDNGYGYGPMGYSFAPAFGAFGKGYYNASDTYPLGSRTMVVEADGNPVAGYEGAYRLPAYRKAFDWGGVSNNVNACIARSSSGRYRNCCVRIYGRALTDAEIARNYAIDRIRFGLP